VSRRFKIRRNDNCPCGSGKKYKKCCEGRVDWNSILRSETEPDWRQYLSIRDRNIHFTNRIAEALQLNNIKEFLGLQVYKEAFTAEAVRKIHEAVMEFWPPDMDIDEVLKGASTGVSGLYIGDYEIRYILRCITRHSIYANKILVVDPFVYPTSVRDEYNPIIEPEQYRNQTLKNVNFWFMLLPWIEAGIIEVIRTPADFDTKLNWESMKRQLKKFEENEELKGSAEKSIEEMKKRHMQNRLFQLLLTAPDSYIKNIFEELKLGDDTYTVGKFLEYIHIMRQEDPNFLEPLGPDSKTGQLHMITTGSSYDIARLTANLTRSYLFTDLSVRWREIELDHASHSVENKIWAPFSKAMQNANLKYLNALRLEHTLILRMEGRLERLRTFLRKVWKEACTGDPFDETNAQLLTEELFEKIQEAEEEWKQIDRDLLNIIGKELRMGLLAAGPLIASGNADFLAAAGIIAGASNLAVSFFKRRSFPNLFPAAFFMKIKDET
jgi:hypothetical protein